MNGDEDVGEEIKEEPEMASKDLPLPDAVKEALADKLDSLDRDIKKYQEQIKVLESKYTTIAKYIKDR